MLDLSLLPDGGVELARCFGRACRHSHLDANTSRAKSRGVRVHAGRRAMASGSGFFRRCARRSASLGSIEDGVLVRVDELPPEDRLLLHERHLVSKELAGLDPQQPVRSGAAVYLSRGVGHHGQRGRSSPPTGARIRASTSPTRSASSSDWMPSWGTRFRTRSIMSSATSPPVRRTSGTGLRASVLIHLPGLVLTKEIGKVLAGLQQVGLTYRGMYGEGSEVVGNFFQISNQTTLGRSEGELLDYLVRVVRHVIEREEEARRVLFRDAGYIIEDKLWRAYGTLRYARSLSFDEAMNYLSGVRLAVGLKLISGLSVYTLNKLLIFSQSAHLGSCRGKSADRKRSECCARSIRARDASREAE